MGVFIFIAIPLPMTGVWTGTAIAVFLGLKFRQVILPVLGGNLIAGAIISVLAELFIKYLDIKYVDYLLYGLFALVVVMLVVFIVKVALTKPKKAEEQAELPPETKEDDGAPKE